MNEGSTRPRTPAPEKAGSEGDLMGSWIHMGLTTPQKAPQSWLNRNQREHPVSLLDVTPTDIAMAVTIAVTDALKDALKMQVKKLGKVMNNQSRSQTLRHKEPSLLHHSQVQLPLYEGMGLIDLFLR